MCGMAASNMPVLRGVGTQVLTHPVAPFVCVGPSDPQLLLGGAADDACTVHAAQVCSEHRPQGSSGFQHIV